MNADRTPLLKAIGRGILCLLLLSLTGCHPKSDCFEPTVEYLPTERDLSRFESPFEPLNPVDRASDWGRELRMGIAFAREIDFYRALTCFKRANLLIPATNALRKQHIDYCIFLSYYCSGRYQSAVEWFERSTLLSLPPNFPAYGDLLILLEDAYRRDGRCDRADRLLEVIRAGAPEAACDLQLSHALREGCVVEALSLADRDLRGELNAYCCCSKSVRKAQWLNALLPGAGYAYVGLTKTAVTSCLLNSLFIAATYRFFERGDVAAGIFTASLECGWYFGGINGAGLAAKEYNEQLYSKRTHSAMLKKKLFPILMVEYAF